MFNAGNMNTLQIDKVIAIVDGMSKTLPAPVKRDVYHAQDTHKHIDLTNGKRTLSVIYLEGGYIATSGVSGVTLTERINHAKKLHGMK